MADGPLRDLRILDLTHVWAGPLATRILAGLGADVLKLEASYARGPAVVPNRVGGLYPGGVPGEEPWNRQAVFNKLNRNKKGLSVDLKAPEGRALFLELVSCCDVVIENFSARAMTSLQLGYDELRKANSKIIYVAMPGYGTRGPMSDFVAFGPSVEPMTGLTSIMGYSESEPQTTAMALPDAVAGVSAAVAVLFAVNHLRETGEGSFMDLSLQEAAINMVGEFLQGK
ncbi:MAG: CoA transferase, partial [Pseudomonadales bacterium]|nr:CoA transferase [Pseudomonadales bacterium]